VSEDDRYQSLIEEVLEHIDVGILIRDSERRVVWVNSAFRKYLGSSRTTVDGNEIRVGDRWLEHRVKRIDRGGYAGGIMELLYDVTERKQIEDWLHAGEVGVWDWNLDTGELIVDPILKMILGYDPPEIRDHMDHWGQLVHPEDAPLVKRLAEEHIAGRAPRYEVAHRMVHKDGSVRWFLARGAVVRDKSGRAYRMAGTNTNITDHKAAEQKLRQSLEEKDTLLKEVHHRVKNNLQIISSLLHMQARHFHDEEARSLVLESQNRIRSMALVHEMLYASEGLAKIDFGDYVSDLAEMLRASYGAKTANVELSIRVDGVVLDLDTAVHLGLILNEVISNAFKHAFPGGRGGHLRIRLQQTDRALILTVQDDGVGLPDDFDPENAGTLGVQLVRAVSKQLGATVQFESAGGAAVRVAVPRMGG
jgi:PAS domain S-box-containing protein